MHEPTAPVADALHETFATALRYLAILLVVLTLVGGTVGYLVHGLPGLWGVLLGVAGTALFSVPTVASMYVSARRNVAVMSGAMIGSWVLKMALLLGAILALRPLEFYSKPFLVGTIFVGAVTAVLLDVMAVLRTRMPYTAGTDTNSGGTETDSGGTVASTRR